MSNLVEIFARKTYLSEYIENLLKKISPFGKDIENKNFMHSLQSIQIELEGNYLSLFKYF